ADGNLRGRTRAPIFHDRQRLADLFDHLCIQMPAHAVDDSLEHVCITCLTFSLCGSYVVAYQGKERAARSGRKVDDTRAVSDTECGKQLHLMRGRRPVQGENCGQVE